jgi:hypothetical protein
MRHPYLYRGPQLGTKEFLVHKNTSREGRDEWADAIKIHFFALPNLKKVNHKLEHAGGAIL